MAAPSAPALIAIAKGQKIRLVPAKEPAAAVTVVVVSKKGAALKRGGFFNFRNHLR